MSIRADSIWAPSPTTTRGQPTQLSSDPKGERLAYANNQSIFLRSIDEPALSTQYSAHTTATTVARFSPSGYYVASGDLSGTVRVWDCVGEGATKGEYHIIGGRINDLAWDGDSARIIAVGDGKEKYGHCITADSGNSVGEISGHSSQINSVSIRQQRPLRAATVSDDTSLVFYHGAPFKFNTSLRKHQRFIYGVAFNPDGSSIVSVGADKQIFLYDGKTGEARTEIGAGEHKGSIFSVSWAKDSKKFVTSSADQTVKIWDVEAGKAIQTWRMGEEGQVSVPDHQVGVVWPAGRSDGLIISLNLNGDLTYLSEGDSAPRRVIRGHQKNITAVALSESKASVPTLFTGSSDGRICDWDITAGTADLVDGNGHSNYVSGIASAPERRIFSVGWDDSLRSIDATATVFTGSASATDGQPKGVAATPNELTAVATHKGVETFKDGQRHKDTQFGAMSPTAIAATDDLLAVAGDDSSLHILSPTSLEPKHKLTALNSTITALSFSPTGQYLAAGFSNGKISVCDTSTWEIAISRWSSHTGRVTGISWNKEGTHAVSGGLDTNVYIWSVKKPGMRVGKTNAHKNGVNGVAWVGEGKVVSVGGDAAVKAWKVEGLS
ncbi:MAG: hypothetical protein LQ352_002089 [Teloschistes flavicans]|nr:MAG: hypothetical protein LQ352_002089 [Teloschistes flavicans]